MNILGDKKLSKLATVHVKKDADGAKRVVNEHKLLSSKQKFAFTINYNFLNFRCKPNAGDFKKCRICNKMTHHIVRHSLKGFKFQICFRPPIIARIARIRKAFAQCADGNKLPPASINKVLPDGCINTNLVSFLQIF